MASVMNFVEVLVGLKVAVHKAASSYLAKQGVKSNNTGFKDTEGVEPRLPF